MGQCLVGCAIAGFLPSQAVASELTDSASSMMSSPPDKDFAQSCDNFPQEKPLPQEVSVTKDGDKYKATVVLPLQPPKANRWSNDLRFRSRLRDAISQVSHARVLNQDEINEELGKSLLLDKNKTWQEQVGEVLNRLLLSKGYITSNFHLLNKTGTPAIYKLIPGQLVKIHPWGKKSGELTIVLERKEPASEQKKPTVTIEIKGADNSITRIVPLDSIKSELERNLNVPQERLREDESLEEIAKRIPEILIEILTSKGHPLIEANLKGKEERVEVNRSKGSISRTFELVWRQEIRNQAFQSYLCRRVKLGVNIPLNANQIEDQLRLLREDPSIASIEGILKKSEKGECPSELSPPKKPDNEPKNQPESSDAFNSLDERKSCLELRVVKAKPVLTTVSIDNYSPPSVGSVRTSADLRFRNRFLFGDEFGVTYANTLTGGNELLEFDYRVPLSVQNGTLQLRVVPRNPSRITEAEFESLRLRGTGELYSISYRQPVIRTPQQELALFAGFTAQNSRIFSEDPLIDQSFTPFVLGFGRGGISQTRVFNLGFDYLTRMPQSAVFFRPQLNIGTDWGTTANNARIPDGQFFSAQIQGQWIQRVNRDIQLLVQGDLQLTPDALLPSQQFVIGGGQSVRGYRQNAQSGDNGFRVSIEPRITLWNLDKALQSRDKAGCLPEDTTKEVARTTQARTRLTASLSPGSPISAINCNSPLDDVTFFVAPFFDVGKVWNQPSQRPLIPNRLFAAVGLGFGVESGLATGVSQPSFSLRLDFGVPLVDSDTRSSNLQDLGLYFSFRYRF